MTFALVRGMHRHLAMTSLDQGLTPRPSTVDTFRSSIALLGTRRFGTFWFASLLSSIGTWAQQVAEPWLLLTLGASSFLLGLDSFAINAPVWLLTVIGGVLADRSDRRRVIALFQSLQMLCPAAIVVLLISGRIKPWMIIALSLVVGITDALSMPSFQSIVPSIVPRPQIGRGLALNATQGNLSRILGPSIAGALISSAGAMTCFVLSAVSYIPFIGVALWILPRRTAKPRRADAPLGRHPFKGIGRILSHANARDALLSVFATGMFCGPLITFSPVLVRDVFHGGPERFSIAMAAFGVGGLLGATALLAVKTGVDRRHISAGFAIVHGGVLVLTGINPWFWGVPPLLILAGASMTVSNTAANSLLQTTASAKLLGQTVSLFILAMRGGISLGALMTGAAISVFGVRHTLLANGIIALVVQAAVARSWLRASLPDVASATAAPV